MPDQGRAARRGAGPRARRGAVTAVLALVLLACGPATGDATATADPSPEPLDEPGALAPPEGAPSPTPTDTHTGEDGRRERPDGPDRPTGSPGAPCPDPLGCFGEPRRVGTFDADVVPEASGLAASAHNPGVLYLLDDRPGTSEVWAIGTDGTMLGAIGVAGLDARDTESLAVGPCGPDDALSCVYVGDIGDNRRSRDAIDVHRFVEPDLTAEIPATVDADRARLTYPDGSHDAEALLVDDAGALYIVTKAPFDADAGTTGEARLYRATPFGDGELDDLGVVPVPEPAAPLHSLVVGNVVTGGDYRGGRVLLRTYDQVLEYAAPEPDADLATLPAWPVRSLPSPVEPQSEAITWAAGGCGYYTAGELVGDLWHVPCEL